MIYPLKKWGASMAILKLNDFKLVEKTEKRKVVEQVVDKMRFLYENWDREDLRFMFNYSRKESDRTRKEVWSDCLWKHDADVILKAFRKLTNGETEFNKVAPTPMQFSAICNSLSEPSNSSKVSAKEIFDMFGHGVEINA